MFEPRGVYAAVVTPFAADLRPDHAALVAHCRELLSGGCDGVSVLGTTGEANSLTVEERMAILTALVEGGIAPDRIMPGTGCCAIGDTVRLTRHALALGIANVLVLPPFYYKTIDEDGLFDAFCATIDDIADNRLQLFLYHIPHISGVAIQPSLIRRLQTAYPRTIAGLKDSSRDWASTQRFLEIADFRVFVGSERFLLPAMRHGGSGCIAAIANVNAPAIAGVYAHFAQDGADARQAELAAAADIIESVPAIPALKAIVAARTGSIAWRAVRPPLRVLDDERRERLLAALGLAVAA